MSKSRAYTKQEIIDMILSEIDNRVNVYKKINSEQNSFGNIRGDLVGYITMTVLDGETGELPYMNLVAVQENADIGGELHSLLNESNESLGKLLNERVITGMTFKFIKKVKELAEAYDKNPNANSEELVASIFDIIDKGIDGNKFTLEAFGDIDEKMENVADGENYFPVEPIVISGDLGKQYREKYMLNNKAGSKTCIDPKIVVKNAAINKKIPSGKVELLSGFWNRIVEKVTGGDSRDSK